MPSDASLYGQRPAKKPKTASLLPDSANFTANLRTLMAASSKHRDVTQHASKQTRSILSKDMHKKNSRHSRAQRSDQLKLKATARIDEAEELDRSRNALQEKARIYSAMKRGDVLVAKGDASLIDFDRKWSEANDGRDLDDSDSADEEDSSEVIEYEDEFGRLRTGTKSDKERMEMRLRRKDLGLRELESLSARPAEPAKLIFGDAIQTMAFNPENAELMEELASKRDRSATPPEMKHYNADAEIRDKGAGFYKFSHDAEQRKLEQEALKAERQTTQDIRRQQLDKKSMRRKEIEARRKEIESRKAKKFADKFLHDLATDLGEDGNAKN